MQSYPDDLDCAWLAIDAFGKLGVFITGGTGPIPEQVLKSEIPVFEIEDALLELPRICAAVLTIKVRNPDSYVDLAERGLFVFDWQNVHRANAHQKPGYDLVALPTQPITASEISPKLSKFANDISFQKFSFGHDEAVDVESAFSCCHAFQN
jgi:hypothetical protein